MEPAKSKKLIKPNDDIEGRRKPKLSILPEKTFKSIGLKKPTNTHTNALIPISDEKMSTQNPKTKEYNNTSHLGEEKGKRIMNHTYIIGLINPKKLMLFSIKTCARINKTNCNMLNKISLIIALPPWLKFHLQSVLR